MRMDQLSVSLASSSDRNEIYRHRHSVYAVELGQHPTNTRESLSDALDEFNIYLVVKRQKRIIGFISITPSSSPHFSIDKYLDRTDHPLLSDSTFVEMRLLTVLEADRFGLVAGLLLHAASRWLQESNDERVIAIGRREVMPLYQKIGFTPLGVLIKCGEVDFELMWVDQIAIVETLRDRQRLSARILRNVDWQLDFPAVAETECYHGGASIESMGCTPANVHDQMDVINADVLDAWYPPCPAAVELISEYGSWMTRTSPPTRANALEETIAEARHIAAENVVTGAGSSDLIFRAFRDWLHDQSRVLLVTPCYGEYEFVTKQVIGCKVDHLELSHSEGFQLTVERFLQRLKLGYDLVVVVNPNNPTGVFLKRSFWESCLPYVPNQTKIWVDECYVDFIDPNESIEPFVSDQRNLIVCKSLSKCLALSGLRIGYLVAPARLASHLRKMTPPWNVGTVSLLAASAAIGDPDYYREKYLETDRLRVAQEERLRQIGFTVFSGKANFFLAWLPENGPDKETLLRHCISNKVFLRDTAPSSPSLGSRAIRLAVKSEEANHRIVDVLKVGLGR